MCRRGGSLVRHQQTEDQPLDRIQRIGGLPEVAVYGLCRGHQPSVRRTGGGSREDQAHGHDSDDVHSPFHSTCKTGAPRGMLAALQNLTHGNFPSSRGF